MENSVSKSYKCKYHIHTYDSDFEGKAHPHILFSMMVDCASCHVIGSNYSYDTLLDEGQLWVLSRFYCEFYRMPKWNDDVFIETWGKSIDRLFGLRDFAITSSEGEKLASATSAWLLIDRKTSRPKRLDRMREDFPFITDRHEIQKTMEKLLAAEKAQPAGKFSVHHTDIDLNKHVTSPKYMQWILESFPEEMLKTKIPHSFEINFLAECMADDKLTVFQEKCSEEYKCEIRRDNDNTVLCRAVVTWK